jgi:WD40 repeat protein
LPSDAPTAFFSYSREDSDFALRLAEDLKAAGAQVWLDQLDITPGQRWARAVQDALNNCPRMLIILSPSSASSTNVEDEVTFALEERKTVIPVFYRECKVPFQLRPFQYIDFRTDYARGLKVLLKTLGVEQHAAAEGPRLEEERKRAAERARLEEERKQAEAKQARLEREKAGAEQQAAEAAAAEQLAREKVEQERRARETAEQERLAQVKAEADRRAARKAEAERAQQETEARAKAEAERKAREEAKEARQQAEAERARVEAEAREIEEAERRARQPEETTRRKAEPELVHAQAEAPHAVGTKDVTSDADNAREAAQSELDTRLEEVQPEARRRMTTKWVIWIAASVVVLIVGIAFVLSRTNELLNLRAHTYFHSVAWSPDGRWLATGGYVLNGTDNGANVWDAETGKRQLVLGDNTCAVFSVAWSPDGKKIAASCNSTAKLWDSNTGKELLTLSGHSEWVRSVAWSPDGERLATASDDKTAKVWNAETGKELTTLSDHKERLEGVAWSPDGKRILTGGYTLGDKAEEYAGYCRVWDAETGKELLTMSGHDLIEGSVTWSPDGKRLAAPSSTMAKVWDSETGKALLTLDTEGSAMSVAWSPDGKRLAVSGYDRLATVWNSETGEKMVTLRGHKDVVDSVAWSPDGKRLATASFDGTTKVWDVGTKPKP